MDIRALLSKYKYRMLVLEDDPDQRFLIPQNFQISRVSTRTTGTLTPDDLLGQAD
jgi:hypothetical protein